MSEDTRERLLAAAKTHFAEKGFYGASIAQIADELKITKQALLYHFKRKEDLYGEVLSGISDKLMRFVRMADVKSDEPERQVEHIFLNLYYAAIESPEDSQLLMREVLDNQARASKAKNWYLTSFLDGIVQAVKSAPGLEKASEPLVFSFVYQVLGSVEYFAISTATLKKMYGEERYEAIQARFPIELQNQVRRFFDDARGG